jgi:hypothetical protein
MVGMGNISSDFGLTEISNETIQVRDVTFGTEINQKHTHTSSVKYPSCDKN